MTVAEATAPMALAKASPQVLKAHDLIQKITPQLSDVLPRHMTPERLVRLLRVMVTRRPQLAECSGISLAGAVIECATLGLEPDTPLGHAWILPFKNRRSRSVDATLIIGYQGYIDLAYRSDRVAAVYAEDVREKDYFKVTYGTERKIEHNKAQGDRGPLTGTYAVAEMMNGAKVWVYLTREEVLQYRKSSPGASRPDSPWNDPHNEPAMWKKTAVRRLQTWLPKNTDMARANAIETDTELGRKQNFQLYELAPDIVAADPDAHDVPEESAASTEDLSGTEALKARLKKPESEAAPAANSDALREGMILGILDEWKRLGPTNARGELAAKYSLPQKPTKADFADWKENDLRDLYAELKGL